MHKAIIEEANEQAEKKLMMMMMTKKNLDEPFELTD